MDYNRLPQSLWIILNYMELTRIITNDYRLLKFGVPEFHLYKQSRVTHYAMATCYKHMLRICLGLVFVFVFCYSFLRLGTCYEFLINSHAKCSLRLYLPLKTPKIHAGKGEPKMFEGIWVDINARTERVFIGTTKGVVKCRTLQRLPEEERWDPMFIQEMEGTRWQPVPGYKSDRVLVEINEDDTKMSRHNEDDDDVSYGNIPLEEDNTTAIRFKNSPSSGLRLGSHTC